MSDGSVNGSIRGTTPTRLSDMQSDVATDGGRIGSTRISIHEGRRPPLSVKNMLSKARSAIKGKLSSFNPFSRPKGAAPRPVPQLNPGGRAESGTMSGRSVNANQNDATRSRTASQHIAESFDLPQRQGPRFSAFYSTDSEMTRSSSIDLTKPFYGEKEFDAIMALGWKDPAEDTPVTAPPAKQPVNPDTEVKFESKLLQRFDASEDGKTEDKGEAPPPKLKTTSNLLWVPDTSGDDLSTTMPLRRSDTYRLKQQPVRRPGQSPT
ncbi:MAG: hypothetical protein AAFQ09_07450 [Pseudomonadota bacterium]